MGELEVEVQRFLEKMLHVPRQISILRRNCLALDLGISFAIITGLRNGHGHHRKKQESTECVVTSLQVHFNLRPSSALIRNASIQGLSLAKTPSGRKKALNLSSITVLEEILDLKSECAMPTDRHKDSARWVQVIGRHTFPAGYGQQLREMFEAVTQAARS
jgi:hypothetical protein